MMLMMAEMVESDCWFLHFHNLYSLLGKPLKEGLVYVFLTKTAIGGSEELKEGQSRKTSLSQRSMETMKQQTPGLSPSHL